MDEQLDMISFNWLPLLALLITLPAYAANGAKGEGDDPQAVQLVMVAGSGAVASSPAVLVADQNASSTGGGTVTTLSTLMGQPVAAGTGLVVAMRPEVGSCPTYNKAGGAGTYHFTDSAGDTFSAVGCQVASGSAFSVMMGYTCNSAGSTSMTFSGKLGTAEGYVSLYAV